MGVLKKARFLTFFGIFCVNYYRRISSFFGGMAGWSFFGTFWGYPVFSTFFDFLYFFIQFLFFIFIFLYKKYLFYINLFYKINFSYTINKSTLILPLLEALKIYLNFTCFLPLCYLIYDVIFIFIQV